MLAIVGTLPDSSFPLTAGKVVLKDDKLFISKKQVEINRGTPALLAAAIKAAEVLGIDEIFGYLVGDIGLGKGSRNLYTYLSRHLGKADFTAITFHYLQPDVDWHNRVLFAIEEMDSKPVLIADAGFMYVAKMSGQSGAYDLFTPDAGELAFLADQNAPHPFYTRGFILQEENRAPDQIARAYLHNNAARYLLVKGKQDYIANRRGILATVASPADEAMEAVGGTGDALTGIVSALIESGRSIEESAVIAARTNRLAGFYARLSPATQVFEIIQHIPGALEENLRDIK